MFTGTSQMSWSQSWVEWGARGCSGDPHHCTLAFVGDDIRQGLTARGYCIRRQSRLQLHRIDSVVAATVIHCCKRSWHAVWGVSACRCWPAVAADGMTEASLRMSPVHASALSSTHSKAGITELNTCNNTALTECTTCLLRPFLLASRFVLGGSADLHNMQHGLSHSNECFRCCWMGQTSGGYPCPGCAPRWGWSARSLCCLPPPSASTLALAARVPVSSRLRRLPRPPMHTTSSPAFLKGKLPRVLWPI